MICLFFSINFYKIEILIDIEIQIETVAKCSNIFNTDKLEIFTTKLVSARFLLDLAFVEIGSCWIVGGIMEMFKMYSRLRNPCRAELG